MRIMMAIIAASIGGLAAAKMPPPSDAAKAQATETAAKAAWSDKVSSYQLCLAMDRTVAAYRRAQKAAGKPPPSSPASTAACVDPGPYVAAAKPLEAAGAHSPPETATSPPSTTRTAAELQGTKK